jgi:hypothetical protein
MAAVESGAANEAMGTVNTTTSANATQKRHLHIPQTAPNSSQIRRPAIFGPLSWGVPATAQPQSATNPVGMKQGLAALIHVNQARKT